LRPFGIFFPFWYAAPRKIWLPWRDSISRPIAPISFMAVGDDTSRSCRQGYFVSFIQCWQFKCQNTTESRGTIQCQFIPNGQIWRKPLKFSRQCAFRAKKCFSRYFGDKPSGKLYKGFAYKSEKMSKNRGKNCHVDIFRRW
jgi:hypothetical protein